LRLAGDMKKIEEEGTFDVAIEQDEIPITKIVP